MRQVILEKEIMANLMYPHIEKQLVHGGGGGANRAAISVPMGTTVCVSNYSLIFSYSPIVSIN
jgi:hypothetical protein